MLQQSNFRSTQFSCNFGSFKQVLYCVYDAAACEMKAKLHKQSLDVDELAEVIRQMQQKRPEGALKILVYNPGALRRFVQPLIAASSLLWLPNIAQQAISGRNERKWKNG